MLATVAIVFKKVKAKINLLLQKELNQTMLSHGGKVGLTVSR